MKKTLLALGLAAVFSAQAELKEYDFHMEALYCSEMAINIILPCAQFYETGLNGNFSFDTDDIVNGSIAFNKLKSFVMSTRLNVWILEDIFNGRLLMTDDEPTGVELESYVPYPQQYDVEHILLGEDSSGYGQSYAGVKRFSSCELRNERTPDFYYGCEIADIDYAAEYGMPVFTLVEQRVLDAPVAPDVPDIPENPADEDTDDNNDAKEAVVTVKGSLSYLNLIILALFGFRRKK